MSNNNPPTNGKSAVGDTPDNARATDRVLEQEQNATSHVVVSDQLHVAINELAEGFALYDTQDRLVFCNQRFQENNIDVAEYFVPGVSFADAVRESIARGLTPESAGQEEEWLTERMRRHRNPGDPFEIQRKNGRCLLVRDVKVPNGTVVLSTDITEHKQAEEALRDSEERFHALFTKSRDAMMLLVDGVYVDCNDACLEMLGATRDQIIGTSPSNLSPERQPDGQLSVEAVQGKIREVKTTGSARFEWVHRRMDGTDFWTEVVITSVKSNNWEGIFGVWRDITARKQAEDSLRESEARFRSIFHSANNGMVIVLDESGSISDWNAGSELAFGYTASEIVGQPLTKLMPERYREAHMKGFARAVAQGGLKYSGVTHELTGLRKDGREFPLELALGCWKSGGNIRFSAFIFDISERKKAEEALRESDEKFAVVFRTAPTLMAITNAESGRIEDVNEAFEQVLGYSRDELLGHSALELGLWVSPDNRAALTADSEGDQDFKPFEMAARTKTGEEIPMLITGRKIRIGGEVCLISMAIDISERKQAEAEQARLQRELQQIHKMEALGQLTGGIAHDFNNILGIMLGFTEFALNRCIRDDHSEMAAYLKHVEKAGLRAKDLVAQMLAYTRNESHGENALYLPSLVTENLKMLRTALPSSIKVNTEIDEDVPKVLMDPIQINQLLMNLCINARDAMDGIGNISIYLGWREVDVECVVCRQQIKGQWVVLSVTDTGSGIKPLVLDNIFDPFFTTKDVGKGTGLGLSVVSGIMRSHGGHAVVNTQLGKGTSFQLLFPPAVVQGTETTTAGPPSAGRSSAELPRGHGEQILIIDDEPELGELLSGLLKSYGYRTEVLASSQKALELFERKPEEFAMVITDQTMPELTGVELLKAMRRRHPNLPAILTTGFSEAIDKDLATRMSASFLEKPVSAEDLLRAVTELLNVTDGSKNGV